MNLPNVVSDLVKAQNTHDSAAYASCFSEKAIVVDEGKTYYGKAEIRQWIETANKSYKTVMEPIDFKENGSISVLKAEISGSFPGSPAVLGYHLELEEGLIQSLKITG
ncbi:nuclear transport factor 2 family protein [Rufibacter latericius]|uniref:Nuclear transport factor 2 family protein n=1 Tax=Rufibacter latericius TaxID=2487040 RepID=A0A3M9MBP3_9BACT|nr:nuclear transport factor 2 family protein [Rufibacter latericius]RNI22585.1 nuclear transport factor 2 family protein [Rufibacter latericius]